MDVSEDRLTILRETLGEEEYKSFVEFMAKKAQAELKKKIQDDARAMISEGGKYFEAYNKAQTAVNNIWDKAVAETKDKLGITD